MEDCSPLRVEIQFLPPEFELVVEMPWEDPVTGSPTQIYRVPRKVMATTPGGQRMAFAEALRSASAELYAMMGQR